MKKSINTIGTIVLIMLVSIIFASCDYFNRPLLDYLEEWTNMAQVSKHTFDDTYPVIDGVTYLPSGKNRVITYYLINPQSYDLGIEVTFDPSLGWDPIRTDNHPDYANTSNQGTVEQDATDKSIIRLTLNENALANLDGDGRDISPTVSIVEPRSGRDFGSYTVPVRVNSPPPVLSNAVIMKYTDSNEKYAVCFNLPAMGAGDIHRDITQITVNGTFNGQPFNNTYQVTGGGTGTVTVDGVPESSSSDYRAIGSDFADTGNTFVGIKTGLDLGPTTPTCTITLTDSSGATTVTAVSTVSTLLSKIYVNEDSGDNNNTGTVSSPVKTIDSALEKLRDVQKRNIILQSDINLTGVVTVGSGISVTVTSDGSERTVINGAGRVFSVTSGGSLIIGGNITLTGTNAGGVGGAVYVDGGSLTMESGSKITGSSADYGGGVYVSSGTFTMNGGTIDGNTADSNGGAVYVDGGSLTMESGSKITGSSAVHGGGVYVKSGIFNMNDGADISGNTVTKDGGGVHMGDGTFTMSNGAIISGNSAASGGGVYVSNTGTFVMSGGTISGNKATDSGARGGGVCVYSGGVFTMSGGIIGGSDSGSANTSNFSGGGVYVYHTNFGFGAGTFDMSGGTIMGNKAVGSAAGGGGVCVSGAFSMSKNAIIQANSADSSGGGVYVTVAGATFTMSGGTISGNSSNFNTGGGVDVSADCTFTMSGTATIKGNTASRGGGVYADGTFSVSGSPTITNNAVSGNANNVYLPGGKNITIGTGGLTGGTIGVTVADMKADDAVQITDKNVTGAANRFTSDVAGYTIMEGIDPMKDAVYLFGGNVGTDVNIEVAYSSSGGKVQFGTFEEARAASATEITLLKDITPTTAPTVSWPITFKWTCTLDLNGYAIDRELTTGMDNGQVIVIEDNGNVTIKDSSATNSDGTNGTGKITGGYVTIYRADPNNRRLGGSGIYIERGTLTLESGSITNNTVPLDVNNPPKESRYGGGVHVDYGTFIMNGGTIRENTANMGGGVYMNNGSFTMRGGIIGGNDLSNGNTAVIGGGVYVSGGIFTMSGGSITRNTAGYGAGVYVKAGTFDPQGGTVSGNDPDDVYQDP